MYLVTTTFLLPSGLVSSQCFHQVLRSLAEDEKSLFLKFVWGYGLCSCLCVCAPRNCVVVNVCSRSRLPLSEAQFTQNFKLTRMSHSNPDAALPVAHTCFFQLDLPPYSQETVRFSPVLLSFVRRLLRM